jgi:hypothetical protein
MAATVANSRNCAYGKTARKQRVYSNDRRLVTAAGASPTAPLTLALASSVTAATHSPGQKDLSSTTLTGPERSQPLPVSQPAAAGVC